MCTRQEVLSRIEECELSGSFDTHVDPINYDLVIKVDDDFPYIRKGFFSRLKHFILKWVVVKPFTFYCNKFMLHTKVLGKKNIKGLKRGVITCNHVNMFDCLAVKGAFGNRNIFTTAASFNNRKDLLGTFMRAGDMMPLSETHSGMRKFNQAMEVHLMDKNHFVLFYPEQAMWWNYEKPRPFKNGAFHYAAKYNVPIIPTFITFVNTNKFDKEGIEKKDFILHIMKPIYPNPKLSNKENVEYLKQKDYEACKAKYEEFYGKELSFSTINK